MEKNYLNIENQICNSPVKRENVKLCAPEKIKNFFEDVSDEVKKLWPLDFSDLGYKTAYMSATYRFETDFKTLTEMHILGLSGICYNDSELYVFEGNYTIDNNQQLCFDFKSLFKEKGLAQKGFANKFMEKQHKFLIAHDLSRQMTKGDLPSEIKLLAASGYDTAGIPIRGGQIWALQGMDFYNAIELYKCRKHFATFIQKNTGIKISDKDLDAFTKPCHFSMFDIGIKVKFNDSSTMSLGKAFMSQYSWRARWKTTNPKSEEKLFATAYHMQQKNAKQRKSNAFNKLNLKYRLTLKKYYYKYLAKQKWSSIKRINRLFRHR